MRITSRIGIAFVFLFVLVLHAQSYTNSKAAGPPGAAANWTSLNASMQRMHEVMGSVESSGDSDVDFVRLMLPHHQAAIDMAKTLLVNGKDPQIRRLAQEMITDQQSEIELMQLWLKNHKAIVNQKEH